MEKAIKHFQSLIKSEQFVITGSYALRCLGLTEKQPKDLDVLLYKPDEASVEILERLRIKNITDYPDSKYHIKVNYEDTNIDFFVCNEPIKTIVLADDIVVSMPKDIFKAKHSYLRIKDYVQCKAIADMICPNDFLDKIIKLEASK